MTVALGWFSLALSNQSKSSLIQGRVIPSLIVACGWFGLTISNQSFQLCITLMVHQHIMVLCFNLEMNLDRYKCGSVSNSWIDLTGQGGFTRERKCKKQRINVNRCNAMW